MNKTLQICLTFLGLLLSSSAFAGIDAGTRAINQVGCNNDNNICWANVSGNPVGPNGCQNTSFRWLSDAANGRETLALLTSALHNGKNVSFWLNDSCFAPQKTFPGIDLVVVNK